MILEQLKAWQPDAIKIRRTIHMHPEIGFEEFKTQRLIVSELMRYGITEINTSFAKTGVVAVINGNRPGPSIGLRADMDALPTTERNTFAHASTIDHYMHGCGHDGHTTMLLMAARYLATFNDFSGRVVLFFQPGEEGHGGAETMVVKERVFDHYPVDEVYALHNWPGLPVGTFAFKTHNIMASSDRLFITVRGKSGHAGLPHKAQDPLLVATHIYQGIQGLVSRMFDPLEPLVVSITQIHAGQTNNVISDEAKLSGTFRTHSKAVRESLIEKLTTLVTHMAQAFGMTATLELGPIHHPVTYNSEAETARAIKAAASIVGSENVLTEITPMMTAEDFAHFLDHRPGCYGFIGNGIEKPHSVDLHNAHYDFNDDIIPFGAAYFVALIFAHSQ
ncbi:amidohydrolase [Wohlfahrtiimonas chitiniclastica]|uniref:amidohydrolase n=1 Tax=Wohlfahrtiimonas chitiniclastica TaxID=400946 RepID=UPI0007B41C7C|nr:amidohydrolase [Wohlfahrtiimonas chitiniclastica]KZS23192.1 hippurate hydrolase [Wohlfahrtiimonas chitiniclastica]WHR55615.1 amidohydrolase [Wohlfahrtiimonas chitiniclastica]